MPGKFSYTQRMRRGGEKGTRSRFVSKEAVERYAQRFGEDMAQSRFGQQQSSDGEEKLAEQVLGTLNQNLQQQQEREAKSFSNMFENQQRTYSSSSFSSPLSVDTSAMDSAAEKQQEALEKQQEQQEEIAEETAEINEATREKVEKLKAERDAKIEKMRSGSAPFPLNIFMSNFTLYIMGGVDFALGWIPIVGDIIAFFVSAVFWFIPCLLLFDLMAYIKILLFLFVDMLVGLIPGIGDFADLAPEFLLAKWGPPAQLRKAWEEKLPAKIERVRQDYDHKIAIAQASGKDKLKKHLARIRGHFSGLAMENQKLVFLLAFIMIIVLGPFGIGAFSETHLLSSIPVVIVIFLLLLLGTKLGLLEQKEMFGLMLFLALNLVLSVMLKSSDFLSQYFKGNTVIVMIFFFAFSLLFILKSMDVISSRTIAIIMILIFLFLSSFQMIGYMGSERFDADMERTQAEREVAWENANLLEKIELWIVEQRLKGSGEYLPGGETEQTYEFMGVTMENPTPLKNVFYSTEPVQVDVDYKANSYDPISISTTCRRGTLLGTIDPAYPVQATASFYPKVRCLFDNLPAGTHQIDVKGVYNYRSTVRLPIKIISLELEQILLVHARDSGSPLGVQDFVGGDVRAITSAGPVQIAVSNTQEMGQNILRMPMAMDASAISEGSEKRVHRIKFQLQESYDETGGVQKIERVRRAQFNLPEGLALSNCNFAPGIDLQPLTEQGRWIYNVVDEFKQWTIFTTLECDIAVDSGYVDTFFPEGVDWSKSTLLFSVDYDYSIQKSAVVRVEA